jgi:starch synthase
MAGYKRNKMKVALISSEMEPFAKTGGLADVAGSLGKYLSANGLQTILIMPFYSSINTQEYNFRAVEEAQECEVWFGKKLYHYSVFTTTLPASNATVYFIHSPELYNRWSLYTNDEDEHLRFAMLSRASLELMQRIRWSPNIIHLNDWQTGLVPLYLKTAFQWDNLFSHTKTVFTIHNIGYQGVFPADIMNDLNLTEYSNFFDAAELYEGKINFLRTGLTYADKLTTVSETYAQEIQGAYFGEGLDGLLNYRKDDLVGILNGVDYEEWNPETDRLIPYHYSIDNLKGKQKNKQALISRLSLNCPLNVPVIGMVSRLTEQKGLDLLRDSIEPILNKYDIRFIVLGSGDYKYEHYLYFLQLRYPEKVVFFKGYHYELSHLIEAGADMFLMPSRYEPCGLNQIYSLKYGTAPIVRKTGGLADTVALYNWEKQTGNGFVFEHYTPDALYWALEFAITTYAHPKSWQKIMKTGMRKNFSWEKQIQKYISLYLQL